MSSLPRSTQQVCHCSQEKLEKAYPEKKISDDCPECESAGKYVRISFHRSIDEGGGFTTPEKQTLKQLAKEKGVKKSPVSSFSRRQEKFKKKLLFRQNADKNLPPNSCDICGQPAANLVAAHIIPYAYRAGIYLEECVHRHEVGASVHSPTDIHNGLLLCPSCDKGFESHDIDITPDGDIRISKEFLKKEGAKYKKLNGTKVRWADEMKDPACPYPSSAVLKYRGTLPIPSSKEGKQLIKKFNAEAREIGYNDEDFDEGGEEEEKEEEEEEEEEEEDRKKKKQKTGKNEVEKCLKGASFDEKEVSSILATVPLSKLEIVLEKAKAKGRSLTKVNDPMVGGRHTEDRMKRLGWELQKDYNGGNMRLWFSP